MVTATPSRIRGSRKCRAGATPKSIPGNSAEILYAFSSSLMCASARPREGACDPREPIRKNKASVAVAVKNLMFPSSL